MLYCNFGPKYEKKSLIFEKFGTLIFRPDPAFVANRIRNHSCYLQMVLADGCGGGRLVLQLRTKRLSNLDFCYSLQSGIA